MKLSRKLPLALAAMLLFAIGAGLFGVYTLRQSIHAYANVIDIDYANEQAVASMLIDFKVQVQDWKDVLLRGKDPAMLDKYWSGFTQQESQVETAAHGLQTSLPPGEAQDLVQQFTTAHVTMGENYRRGLEAFKAANFDPSAGDASVKGMDRAPSTLLAQARDKIVDATRAGVADAQRASERATIISIAMMLVALVSSVMLGTLFSRSITRPLAQAVRIAQTIAAGDLTSTISVRSKDETGELMQALQSMNASLQNIIGQVRHSTQSVATASREIAGGNLDLSSRTEAQASALEETASSMEELISAVRQNAQNSVVANQHSVSATQVADQCNAVFRRVTDTMGSISDSSKKIADIIGVIDGIAFQTNLLALNAAVEAARAGEQGRGFSVVASEVRNLAQRSADAARQIKQIIDESAAKVAMGQELVRGAGSSMSEVVESVKRVTSIVGEVALASREQTAGIDQINVAITQMDQSTQQNAALVEQAAATAASLEEQSRQLSESIAIFKVDDAKPAPARPASSRSVACPAESQAAIAARAA